MALIEAPASAAPAVRAKELQCVLWKACSEMAS